MKPALLRSNNHNHYWGVLARDAATQTVHRPNIFMSLLQAQYQNTQVPGQDKPNQHHKKQYRYPLSSKK